MKIGNGLTAEVDLTLCVYQDKGSWINQVRLKYSEAFATRCEELTKDLPDVVSSWPTGKNTQIIEQVSLEFQQQSQLSGKPEPCFGPQAPKCPKCGHPTVNNGASYRCLSCGNTGEPDPQEPQAMKWRMPPETCPSCKSCGKEMVRDQRNPFLFTCSCGERKDTSND